MNTIDIVVLTIQSLCLILILRSHIAFTVFRQRLDYISGKSHKLILEGKEWRHLYYEMDSMSYLKFTFTLTCWKYDHFFKEDN